MKRVLALLLVIVIWLLMSKTTLGYEIRACGLDRKASRHAGIRTGRRILLAAAFSGAMAGLAGAMYCMLDTTAYSVYRVAATFGFFAAPAALFGAAHPLAGVLSAVIVSWIRAGYTALKTLIGTQDADLTVGTMLFGGALILVIWRAIQRKKDGKWQ